MRKLLYAGLIAAAFPTISAGAQTIQNPMQTSATLPAGMIPLGPGAAAATVDPAPAPAPSPSALPPVASVAQTAPASAASYPYTPGAAPPSPPTPADLAFEAALRETAPLSDKEIHDYRSKAINLQRMQEAPVGNPRPSSRSVVLSLQAGEKAPSLSLAPGNATVLTFYDQTGAAWPVESVTVGNPTAYNAQEAGEKGKTNMVVISPLSNFASANLVVTLVGYPVPVLFSLQTGSGRVDYRLDVEITARGPNAHYDMTESSSLQPTNDPTVQSFIDDVAPKGAVKVTTTNSDVEAWRYKDMLYVRTTMELLSPAYIGRAHHPSGVNVFTLADAPVLMFEQDGRMEMVQIDR